MIVQCDQCNSKFRLDDSKVKEGGVKVRCSKCKNIFVVQAESPAEEGEFDSFLSGLMSGAGSGAAEESPPAAEPSVSRQPPEEVEKPVKAAPEHTAEDIYQAHGDFDLSEFTFSEQSLGSEPPPSPAEEPVAASRDDFDLSEFSFSEEPLPSAPQPGPSSKAEHHGDAPLSFGELDLGGAQQPEPVADARSGGIGEPFGDEFAFKAEPAPPLPEFELDIDGFTDSAGMEAGETAIPPEQPKTGTVDAASAAPVPDEFSFDTGFGSPPSGKSDEDFFSTDSPAFSFEPEEPGTHFDLPGKKEPKSPDQPAPFDFDAFDIGGAAAPEAVESVKQGAGTPESQGQGVPVFSRISAPPVPEMPAFEDEPPPLSISSRRRSGSNLPMTLIVVAVVLLLCAGGGFYLFKQGPAAFNSIGLGFLTSWFGGGSKEEGKVTVRNISAQFLNNNEMGEIFVIRGEAVNNYGKPRASIQVRATLFGAKGEVVMQKAAYCGNLLSGEQLAGLPAAKIEAAMNNQFGDSLSNLAVQPAKGIPFVIVLSKVPKEIGEFGVEVVGSTVSTQ